MITMSNCFQLILELSNENMVYLIYYQVRQLVTVARKAFKLLQSSELPFTTPA